MHIHYSCKCEHKNVKWCKHCDLVYCVDCAKEWKFTNYTFTYYSYWPQPGVTYYPVTSGYETTSGYSLCSDNLSCAQTVPATHQHQHS